jgi:hypothetical protein
MMGAAPFLQSLSSRDAEAQLTKSLSEVLAASRSLAGRLGARAGAAGAVSSRMRAVRRLDVKARLGVYCSQRIHQQRKWYSDKADGNHRAYKGWFLAVLLAQLIALVSAAATVANREFPVNPAVFAAAASAFWAWFQAKRFQELAQAYGLAAHELALIESQAAHVSGEQELAEFVADAENAISREHTMWVARKAGS